VTRGILEELNLNIENSKIIIDNDLHKYHHIVNQNVIAGTIYNAYVNITDNVNMSFNNKQIIESTNNDQKGKKVIITMYGKTELLKTKIENAFLNNNFCSNEKNIEYILLIPINELDNIFSYVKSDHISVGSNKSDTNIQPKKYTNTATQSKTNKKNKNIVYKNIFDILNDDE